MCLSHVLILGNIHIYRGEKLNPNFPLFSLSKFLIHMSGHPGQPGGSGHPVGSGHLGGSGHIGQSYQS